MVTKLIHLQCIARAQNCLTSMFVKGGQISERGAKFPRKYGPRGGGIFPRKFGPGGPYFGGAKFPGTPANICLFMKHVPLALFIQTMIFKFSAKYLVFFSVENYYEYDYSRSKLYMGPNWNEYSILNLIS